MKLGTIVGIVFSCLLIIGGIVLCSVGISMAEENGQSLYIQKDKDGTYHRLLINDEITRIDLDLENVDVIVSGNADVSEIEFYNFNPNNYALTVTTNVISFEETPKIESVSDILTNGFNFKGLRYVLDIKGYKYESDDKRVVINLASDADIKILDIATENGSIDISKLSTDSDISVTLDKGKLEMRDVVTSSVIDISGTAIDTSLTGIKSLGLKYSTEKSDLTVTDSVFTTGQISVGDGSVNYSSSGPIDNTQITASSDTGSLLVNSISNGSPWMLDSEDHDKTLDIKCKTASINITYPLTEATDEDVSADANE